MHLQRFLLLTTLMFSGFTLFGSQTQSLLSSSQKGETADLFEGTRLGLSGDFAQAKQTNNSRRQQPKTWYKKIGRPALAYTLLALFGFIHGVTNNYLSKGAPNQHCFKAPLREWLVGLGFRILNNLLICFEKTPDSLRLNNEYLTLFTLCATRGGGQALGEMIPLNGHWRNFAVNQWALGIPVWLNIAWHSVFTD